MGYASMRRLTVFGRGTLASLVPLLPEDALPAAEAAARSLEPADRARALTAIRDRLGTARLDPDILAAARAAGPEASSSLLAWAAGASAGDRQPVLLEAIRAAEDWDRASTLAEAVEIATPDGLAGLLAEANTVDSDDLPLVIGAFDGRAADLPADVRAGVLALANAPRRRAAREERLGAAIHLLDGDERDRLVRAAIAGWDDGDGDDGTLLATLPFWPPAERVAVATQWLGASDWSDDVDGLLSQLGPEDVRPVFAEMIRWPPSSVPPEAFASLVACLPAEDRAAAVTIITRRLRGRRRVTALAGLARGHADVLEAGLLEAGRAGPAGEPSAGVWAAVIEELGRDVPPALVPRAIEVVRRAANRRLRLRLLALLAGLAEDPLRSSVADEVVDGLAASPTVLGWEGLDSLALAATPEQAWAAIAIVRTGLHGAERDDALRILAGALDDRRLVDLVEELAGSKPAVSLALLEEYAASLARPARVRAMAATGRVRDAGDRAVARAMVLASGGPVDDVTPNATLDLALESGDEAAGRVIELLAGQLPPGRVLEATLALRDHGTRWWVLTSLDGRLPQHEAAIAERELRALDEEDLAGGGGMGAAGPEDVEAASAADAASALEALFPGAEVPGWDRTGADQAALDGTGAARAGPDRSGFDQEDPDRSGADSAGPDRSGADGSGADGHAGADVPPAHIAYGLLDAPAEVVVAQPFTLEVGISSRQAAGVAGPPLRLPPVSDAPYLLDVRIAAPGFTTPPGESRQRSLAVSRATPYPTTTITLVPKPAAGGPDARPITAEFWVAGERLGDAIRYVEVLSGGQARTRPEADRVQAGVNVPIPSGADVPDLTISIRRSYPRGRTEWTLGSPHGSAVAPDDDPYEADLEGEAEGLLANITQIDAADGKKAVFGDVLALANRVSACIPDQVWTAIRAAAAVAKGPPSILLMSEEPYVPWELARVDPPLVPGSTLPPFLAAQSRVSRWVLATRMVDGRARPPADAPRHKEIASTGVVTGTYGGSRWANLVHAKAEAKEIQVRFAARRITPTNEAMFELLKGNPAGGPPPLRGPRPLQPARPRRRERHHPDRRREPARERGCSARPGDPSRRLPQRLPAGGRPAGARLLLGRRRGVRGGGGERGRRTPVARRRRPRQGHRPRLLRPRRHRRAAERGAPAGARAVRRQRGHHLGDLDGLPAVRPPFVRRRRPAGRSRERRPRLIVRRPRELEQEQGGTGRDPAGTRQRRRT